MIFNVIGKIVEVICFGSLGLSTAITALNVSSSNNRIRRKGYDIKSIGSNSLVENIKYAIKDYAFLLVPVLNVVKSIGGLVYNDKKFDEERIKKLEDRDRIVKISKTSNDSNNEEQKETVSKKEEPNKKSSEKSKELPPAITTETMTCYERRDYYKNEYNNLRALHAKYKSEGKSVTILNGIVAKMKEVIAEYQKADRECSIKDLKAERNLILSKMEKGPKLIKK